MEKLTDFGYTKVSESEKTARVKGVFDSVATNYDIMNDLMSLGIHRLWKKLAIAECNIRPSDNVLDLASGTADIALQIARKLGTEGTIVVSDINISMLKIGRDKLINNGLIQNINYSQINAELLPFPDDYFNCVTIAFGLRNVTNKSKALSEMYRVLAPGGRLVVLEFSHPNNNLLQKAYDLYSFNILPKLGKIVAKDSDSYSYLAESIRMHPKQEELKQMLLDSGFDECIYKNLFGGICTIHKGLKY